MVRRPRLSHGSMRSNKSAASNKHKTFGLVSDRVMLLLKALFVWALFTIGGWIAIPVELVPLFSHCVGLGFYLVIVTQKARWLIPVSLGGFLYLGIVYFSVPPSLWATTTHILGYAGLIILVVTHFCLKWVGADLQPQAERMFENLKEVFPSVDMMPTAERILHYLGPLLRDRPTLEHLLESFSSSISDGITNIDEQRAYLLDWLIRLRLQWLNSTNSPYSSLPSSSSMGGIGPALGALLARALAMAADCPGGIGSALGSTAEALLARLLALYPKRCVQFLLDILAEEEEVEEGLPGALERPEIIEGNGGKQEKKKEDCFCGLREALLAEKDARLAAESALEVARCQVQEIQQKLDQWEKKDKSFEKEEEILLSEEMAFQQEPDSIPIGQVEKEVVEKVEDVPEPDSVPDSSGTFKAEGINPKFEGSTQVEENMNKERNDNEFSPTHLENYDEIQNSRWHRESLAFLRPQFLENSSDLHIDQERPPFSLIGSYLSPPAESVSTPERFSDPFGRRRVPNSNLNLNHKNSNWERELSLRPQNFQFSDREAQGQHSLESVSGQHSNSLDGIETRLAELLASVRAEQQQRHSNFSLRFGAPVDNEVSMFEKERRICWRCGGYVSSFQEAEKEPKCLCENLRLSENF